MRFFLLFIRNVLLVALVFAILWGIAWFMMLNGTTMVITFVALALFTIAAATYDMM